MEPGAPFAWPETDEVGSGVAAAIGMDKYACLMAKHGADAVSDTLEKACDRAYYLRMLRKSILMQPTTGRSGFLIRNRGNGHGKNR